MIIIISPAKTLDFESKIPFATSSSVRFSKEAVQLVSVLKRLSVKQLTELMSVSNKLAEMNAIRYSQWQWPFPVNSARPALFAFKGEVYTGLDAYSLTDTNIEKAQHQLRILSGLYGLLRPLDNIMPYRLEMGTKLQVGRKKDLYGFWGDKITTLLSEDIRNEGSGILVNLASKEYFKSLDIKKLKTRIITPVFKEYKNGSYQLISFFAKKARGLMARFIIENQISEPEDIKAFDLEGYHFNNELSKENILTFTRH